VFYGAAHIKKYGLLFLENYMLVTFDRLRTSVGSFELAISQA
jgi:hypothetical protein